MEELKKDIPWLKRMENGAIGESRTKSFLLDRFWVLERSVDIEGADFLIQRKLFRDELFNKTPSVLGIIQVKFYDSENTSHYIPLDYFLDNNEPRKDFFVILNTGKEDDWAMFFLSADDLNNDFTKTEHKGKQCVYLPGKQVLLEKYKINSRAQCLNRIENSLTYADFKANRKFLLSNHFVYEKNHINEGIEPIYQEYIPNDIDNIKQDFIHIKKEAQSSIYRLEDIIEIYKDLMETTDPEKAIEIIEDLDSETSSSYNSWSCNRSLSWKDDILKENLENAINFHKYVYGLLKKDGLLDYSNKNKEILYREVSNLLITKSWEEQDVIFLRIELNPKNLFEIKLVKSSISNNETYQKISNKQTGPKPDLLIERENLYCINYYFHPTHINCYINGRFKKINEEGICISEDLNIYNEILLNIIKTKYNKELKDWY